MHKFPLKNLFAELRHSHLSKVLLKTKLVLQAQPFEVAPVDYAFVIVVHKRHFEAELRYLFSEFLQLQVFEVILKVKFSLQAHPLAVAPLDSAEVTDEQSMQDPPARNLFAEFEHSH